MKKLAILLAVAAVTVPAMAASSLTFDTSADTADWYADRYAPQVFESGVDGGGRTGVLHQGLRADGQQGNRGAQDGDFYNYQGMKYDVNLQGTGSSVAIDLFADSTWATGSRVGFWTTMSNGNLSYPIIEFAVNADNSDYGGSANFTGFRWWQSGTGWTDGIEMDANDQWHNLNVVLVASDVEFYIDGSLLSTVDNLGAHGIDNIILNMHNEGTAGEYDAYWDNLNAQVVPAPGAILLGSLGVGMVSYLKRRRSL